MPHLGRLLATAFAALATAAAIAEGAGLHGHALQENDRAPHDLMVVERTAACDAPLHLDTAVPHRHAACGSCTLASTPSAATSALPAVGAAPAIDAQPVAMSLVPRGTVRDCRGPARAPPLPAPLDA